MSGSNRKKTVFVNRTKAFKTIVVLELFHTPITRILSLELLYNYNKTTPRGSDEQFIWKGDIPPYDHMCDNKVLVVDCESSR